MSNIKSVSSERMSEIINNPLDQSNKGLFYSQNGDKFIGCDNTEGYAWTEEFDYILICQEWLKGSFEFESPEHLKLKRKLSAQIGLSKVKEFFKRLLK